MIGIIDYGMGNIHSVYKALGSLGADTVITNDPGEFERIDKLVLPGVGAFSDAMEELERRKLVPAILESIARGKIFLGICLGLQLLFESSAEAPGLQGLKLLQGKVSKFNAHPLLKVPHMGWNQLDINNTSCPLFNGLPDKPYVYFCHSYYAEPIDKSVVSASCNYGGDFAAVVSKANIYGVQFHPEKSQQVGMQILKNFVEM